MTKFLGLHETLEVHELLTFKNLCLTKATTMNPFVQDPELRAILESDIVMGIEQIKQLHGFLTNREEHS